MPARLGVGIIGLGRRWQRYRPALHNLRGRLRVRAVCDQRPARAERAARELGCAAAAGPTDLLDRDDVQAALLLDAQWFGLWPLEQAARLGKPVFCAVPLSRDDAHADDVMQQVRAGKSPVMAALGPSFFPAVTRLRELLATRLGGPQLVRCDWCGPEPVGPADIPGTHALPALLHACAGLLGAEPLDAWMTAAPAARFVSVLSKFPGGKAAALNLWAGKGVRSACRFQAVTEVGGATASLPRTLRWRDRDGRHTVRMPHLPWPRLLLERFLDALSVGAPPDPTFEEAYRALLWARAALQSLWDRRPVTIQASSPEMRTE